MGEAVRVEVESSPVRCPYCHESIRPASEPWVACASCLARHHEGCWTEGRSRCASCGAARVLAEATGVLVDGKPTVRPVAPRRPLASAAAFFRRHGRKLVFWGVLFLMLHRSGDLCSGLAPSLLVAVVASWAAPEVAAQLAAVLGPRGPRGRPGPEREGTGGP